MRYSLPIKATVTCVMLFALVVAPAAAERAAAALSTPVIPPFAVTPLVSDIPGLASFTDEFLVNPWGMVMGTTGDLLVADNGTGVATLYTNHGIPLELIINIPVRPDTLGPSLPTGLVLNETSDFVIQEGIHAAPARAIFATEQGVLAGWSPEVNLTEAIVAAVGSYTPSEAPVYTGLTMATDADGNSFLYAADFRHDRVDVYDGDWNHVGSFTDPRPHAPLAPYGVATLGNLVWVAFAPPEQSDTAPAQDDELLGFVDIFAVDGTLLKRFVTGGPLNSPWGITAAPRDFLKLPDMVLIGNEGDGRISVFDRVSGHFRGQLAEASRRPIERPGLWTLLFPPKPAFSGFPSLTNPGLTLFFTAGINEEEDGLLGVIRRSRSVPIFPRISRDSGRR